MKAHMVYGILGMLLAGVLWMGLILIDRHLASAHTGSIGDTRATGARLVGSPDLTLNTFDVYPWTGGHTQANARGVDGLRSGDHGFFIDFDLDRPPPKAADERRIIWTGGSGAAGWGATTNAAFVASLLQDEFRRANPCADNGTLRVINLAMGGSKSYQNFIALNYWGHGLNPDMIVSFSGHNDMDALTSGGAVWRGYYTLAGLALMTRYDESPGWLKTVGRFFPNIARNVRLGNAVRSFNLPQYEEKARDHYAQAFNIDMIDPSAAYGLLRREYIHALRSIKRDFVDVPLAVIQQPYMASDASPGKAAQKTPLSKDQWIGYYQQLYEDTRNELSGSAESGWIFFSAHQYYADNMAARYQPDDGVHMSDAKQAEIAKVLAGLLFPKLCSQAIR